MNRASYLRCIDGVRIEFESLFLFLLFCEKCCCVRHGESLSALVAIDDDTINSQTCGCLS